MLLILCLNLVFLVVAFRGFMSVLSIRFIWSPAPIPRSRPWCSVNLHVISSNLYRLSDMRGVFYNLVKHLDVWQGSQYGSGYVSLFETKKIMVLNSVFKN